jgi:plastocyanin
MIKENAVLIASVVTAGATVATYILSARMNIGVEGSGISVQQPTATSHPRNSTVVKIVANSGSNSFSPNHAEVKVGETVTWINDDSGRHSVNSKDRVFNSELMGRGQPLAIPLTKQASTHTLAVHTPRWWAQWY